MNNRGSFLLETMISLVILSIMAIVFAQGFGRTSGSIKNMGDDRTLVNMAQAKMERLVALGFGNNNAGDNGLGIGDHTPAAQPVLLDGGNHNIGYEWEVTGIDQNGGLSATTALPMVYKRIVLTTTMDANTEKSITLTTLVGDN